MPCAVPVTSAGAEINVEAGLVIEAFVLGDHESNVRALIDPVEPQRHVLLLRLRLQSRLLGLEILDLLSLHVRGENGHLLLQRRALGLQRLGLAL